MKASYNIHNLVTVSIDTARPEIIKEYEYYIREFKLAENLENAHVQIKNVPDASMSLHILMERFLLKKGFTFIHAAAISYKGQGILFPALGGIGKTMLISKLRNRQRVKFFGDDFAIVGNKQLYSFPSDFSIYNYHFNFFPELKKTPARSKIRKAFFEKFIVRVIRSLPIKKSIKRLAGLVGYDYLMGGEYLKIPAKTLVSTDNMGSQAPLQQVVLLEKHDGSELKFQSITPIVLAKRIIEILQLEWKEVKPAPTFFGDIEPLLIKEFEGLTLTRVFLPGKLENEKRMEQLLGFLEKKIFSQV